MVAFVVIWVGVTAALAAMVWWLARSIGHNRRRLAELERRVEEQTEVDAILDRARRPDGRDRRHLRLLGLIPFGWLVDRIVSRPAAAAAATAAVSMLAGGTIAVDRGIYHPPATTPPAEASPAPPPAAAGPIHGRTWTMPEMTPPTSVPPQTPATAITPTDASAAAEAPSRTVTPTTTSTTTTTTVDELLAPTTTVPVELGCLPDTAAEAALLHLELHAGCPAG